MLTMRIKVYLQTNFKIDDEINYCIAIFKDNYIYIRDFQDV